jgi:transcriptional regulator with XRE-family HTH domain/Zn-dependent peptidase ImmA (M78 family)
MTTDKIFNLLGRDDQKSLSELFEKRKEELGLSQNQIENILGVEYRTLTGIINRTAKRVDILNVFKLGYFLGVEPEELIQLYVSDMSSDKIGEIEKVKRTNFIAQNFDLNNLKKIGFIDSINDFEHIENRITNFFGLNSVIDFNRNFSEALFSRTRRKTNNKMLDFWVKSAYSFFEKLDNPNIYDRDALVDLIPQIRPYTRDVKDGLRVVSNALANVGVSVIFQPHLPTTQVRGGTFYVNDNPCIVITDLNKNYATLWFALFHELYHVLYDLERIQEVTYHLRDEPDIFLIQEENADNFAQDYLFSDSRLKYIAPLIHNHLAVRDYAEECQIHPSIIYSFFQYAKYEEGENYWGAFSEYFPSVEEAVEKVNIYPWDKKRLDQSVQSMVEKFEPYQIEN